MAGDGIIAAIALAGGYRGSAPELVVRVVRRGQASEGLLASLSHANIGGMPLEPGDRVEVIRRSRTFSVLGTGVRPEREPLRPCGHICFPLRESR